jgi:quinolinate synthase
MYAEISAIVHRALQEDIGSGDVTTEWTLPANLHQRGRLIAKAPGIIAGLEVARVVFETLDKSVRFVPRVADGAAVSPRQTIATIDGSARSILAGERVALNLLQRMSGIATLTSRYAAAVQGTKAIILDTRKTAPGLRILDKMAVRLGGGQNHRIGLYDMVLIKDNHIAAAGSITAAVQAVKSHNSAHLKVEVEVKNLDELREALALDVDRIMLDNMNLEDMREAVSITAGRTELEASGGVSLDTVADIARTRVDLISVGALTHSVTALDISLDLESQSPTSMADYQALSEDQVFDRIEQARRDLGKDLVILAHHYQRDEVVRFADYRGDSLELSRVAADVRDARYIVFCGVDFMAETAAMLCAPTQTVCIPARAAVCPMAQMANAEQALVAWQHLSQFWGDDIIPITYQNSYASVKAFCGERGGAVCTSANAQALFRWALKQKSHILFFPDEHLGTNSALALGIPRSKIVVWNPAEPEASARAARDATVVVWKGYCHVHTFFTVEQVAEARRKYPGIQVVVHPECPAEVVAAADSSGSTSHIIRVVESAPPGASFAIGTEIHMVARLAKEHPNKLIVPLARGLCGAMYTINPYNLSYTLDHLLMDDPVNVVTVALEIARWANLALQRMLEVK